MIVLRLSVMFFCVVMMCGVVGVFSRNGVCSLGGSMMFVVVLS